MCDKLFFDNSTLKSKIIQKTFTVSLAILLTTCAEMGKQTVEEINSDSKENNTQFTFSSSPDAEKHGAIIPINSLSVARAAHTATVLKNGSVLICGGFAGSTLSSAEVYNPHTKRFTSLGNLSTPRSGHSATILHDGKVLIAGGYNGNYLASTEIYVPGSGTFHPGPTMTVPRSGHTATMLENRKILFAGGVGTGWSFLSSSELYDIQSHSFSTGGSMMAARESHTATLLNNGTVLITGGHWDRRQNIKIYSSAEIYNPATGSFTKTGNMTIRRHKHDAILLSNGKVLINGGSDERDGDGAYKSVEIYDPISAKFQSITSMNYSRYKHNGTSVLLENNYVLIAGGTNKGEVYDFKSGKFFVVAGDMKTKKLFTCATRLLNGDVLITGGYDENIRTSKQAWLYIHSR